MRRWIRLLLVGLIFAGPAAGTASALTLLDLLKLKTAGISDDVLVAVINADPTVFQLTPDDIVMLRKNGLSDKVIIALLMTVNRPPRLPAAPAVPLVESPVPQIPQVPQITPPPVVVNVTQTVEQHVEQAEPRVIYQSVPVVIPVGRVHDRERDREPLIFWGHGGQRRTDSWSTPQIERNERARAAQPEKTEKKDEKPIKK
jgi:hypothetical protein